jgi:hypothetical protein
VDSASISRIRSFTETCTFPLRPLVEREIRTLPSPTIVSTFVRQEQLFTGLWHFGQVRPCSVEYTMGGESDCDFFMSGM